MRYIERTVTSGRIDATAGVLYGVKLVGPKSRNRRQYTNDCLAAAAPRYEGVKVYLNHPEVKDLSLDRKFEHWVGVVKNARMERGAIYGDIELRQSSSMYGEIIEAAEKWPTSFGCSHVADGESHIVDGLEIVESISQVFSVDLVTDPASTAGLFESVDAGDTSRAEVKALCERLKAVVKHGIGASDLDAAQAIALGGLAIAVASVWLQGDSERSVQDCLDELEAINDQLADLVPAGGGDESGDELTESYRCPWMNGSV